MCRQACPRAWLAVGLVTALQACSFHNGVGRAPQRPPAKTALPAADLASRPISARESARLHAKTALPAADLASLCEKAATDKFVTREKVYRYCIAAYRDLLRSRKAQPYRDDDAVTAAILEIYAAYALDARASSAEAREMIRDAREILVRLSATGASRDVRQRAITAQSCLIDRDGKCRDTWAKVQ